MKMNIQILFIIAKLTTGTDPVVFSPEDIVYEKTGYTVPTEVFLYFYDLIRSFFPGVFWCLVVILSSAGEYRL